MMSSWVRFEFLCTPGTFRATALKCSTSTRMPRGTKSVSYLAILCDRLFVFSLSFEPKFSSEAVCFANPSPLPQARHSSSPVLTHPCLIGSSDQDGRRPQNRTQGPPTPKAKAWRAQQPAYHRGGVQEWR